MENEALFLAYLLTWPPYVLGIHAYARWKRISHAAAALSHAAPSLVAISMAYIFLIGHGATVRQFVASSDRGMGLWSLWVMLWPLLLHATFGAGALQAVLTLVAVFKRGWRKWILFSSSGTAMAAFAFMTVAQNFPDA